MPEFLNPQQVLNNLDLEKNMVAADFGSGSGGWVLPLAKKLEDGKVYAIDILEEPLSVLKSRAQMERILNIETIRSNVEDFQGSKLIENSTDLILMTNLLFQVEKKKEVMVEAKRILRKGGKILVVDWLLRITLGPKEGRVSPEEVKKIAGDLGLEIEKEFKAGIYHFGLVFTKPK